MAIALSEKKIPNFPSKPNNRHISFVSMPNDLVANKRSYFTEIYFLDYRTAVYNGNWFSSFLNFWLNPISNIISGDIGSGAAIRLPIPRQINDITTLNWEVLSGSQMLMSILPLGASQLIGAGGKVVGALTGKALNPLLFTAFNNQNFREFVFEWVLSPRNSQESSTIKKIISMFKNASLPTNDIIMDYPLIAMVRMSPNNLNGHAIFKPMAIQAVAANYTPNPSGPSFFGETGAPTMVTLTVKFLEIKLFYRGEVL